MTSLMAWLASLGADVSALDWPAPSSTLAGRGAVAKRDVAVGTPLLSIPSQAIMPADRARRIRGWDDPDRCPILASDDAAALAAWLVGEWIGATSSSKISPSKTTSNIATENTNLTPYVLTLPPPTSTHACGVLDWTDEQFVELQDGGEMMAYARKRNEQIRSQFEAIIREASSSQILPPSQSKEEALRLYRWAMHMVSSRVFGRRLEHLTFVPLADALNHANVPRKYSLENDIFTLWSTGAPIRKGEEVFNSYGRHSNYALLVGYGFCLDDNEWDAIKVTLAIQEEGELGDRKRSILKQGNVPKETTLLARDVVPTALLQFYRVMVATSQDLDYVETSPFGVTTAITHAIGVQNEVRAVKNAADALEGLLGGHATSIQQDETILQDKTTPTWLVNATRHRIGRKRILRFVQRFFQELAPVGVKACAEQWTDPELRRAYPAALNNALDAAFINGGAKSSRPPGPRPT